MIGILIALLLGISAVGYGAMLFRVLNIRDAGSPWLVTGLCFAAGFGLIGWVIFPLGVAGQLDTATLWTVVNLGVLGLWFLRDRITSDNAESPTLIHWGLLLLFLVVGLLDVLQAMAPPSDADSLAYHFALPKQFIQAGEIFFVPRAIDGAVPLLVQMGYIPALALGGEQALTFWVMLSSWALYFLVYGLARTRMSVAWSLAVTLAVATTPTVIYGSVSGQVEVRIALFVLLAAWAAARAIKTGHVRYIILCGLAAGLYGASKYVGLIFMASTAIVIIIQPRWFRVGVMFSLAAVIASGQWYLWNFVHTGDPIFPVLFPLIGVSDPAIWDLAHHRLLKDVFFAAETPIPVTPFGLLSYPFIATFFPPHNLDAGRAGLGPFMVLLLPFALAVVVSRKIQWQWNTIAIWSAMVIGFVALWFFVGSPQRIRHLLPVWPLALLLLFFAVQKCAKAWNVQPAMGVVIAAVLIIQVGGAAIFGIKFFDVATGHITPEVFREKTISHYAPVPWLNANLDQNNRVLTTERLHLYDLDVPTFFAQDVAQAIIPIHPAFGTETLIPRMIEQGITHIVVYTPPGPENSDFPEYFSYLLERDCVEQIHTGLSTAIASRTLARQRSTLQFHVFRFTPNRCLPDS